ncbi:MAG: hypothetical protein COA71_10110 [SAR86 cluster bacterium]|uniref:Transporter n=1 Tax=SAR86 cluster bacterium TaxID=2030880 RepID=A0A2A5CAX8_9GAMM|nr:MAG: hypothetical protein COA71_10110 [SAR86 cluster bacterium]
MTVAPFLASCIVVPDPFSQSELAQIAQADRELIFRAQEELPAGEFLTLEKAFAMALKYNLENRVALLEATLANNSFDLSRAELLPDLAANAGYTNRSNDLASFSNSVATGDESLESSSSQEREQVTGDISFSWNLLDFGLSYLTAKQGADNYLIADKARQKVMLTLLQEVRSAYWYAVAMEAMEDELEELYLEAEDILDDLQVNRREGLQDPISVLTEMRTIIETLQVLDQVRQSISTSKTRLAQLINIENLDSIRLEVSDDYEKLFRVSDDPEVMQEMELYALTNSSDYIAEVYNARIEQDETRKTMLQLFPGLEFSYGENYTSNRFSLNDSWGQLSANITGDLMNLVNVKTIRKFRDTSELLTLNRKLAINMAVVAGVNITWQEYQNSLIQFDRAALLNEIDSQLFELTNLQEANSVGTNIATIQSKLRAFSSSMGERESYASAQTAYGAYLSSLGVNPIPNNYMQIPVDNLADSISANFVMQMEPFLSLNAIQDIRMVYINDTQISGNLLGNDILKTGAEISSILDKNDELVVLGREFITDNGGRLVIESDGAYQYRPPSRNEFNYDDLEELFTYTITDESEDQDNVIFKIVGVTDNRLDSRLFILPGFGPNIDEFMGAFLPVPQLEEYLEIFLPAPSRNDFIEAFEPALDN